MPHATLSLLLKQVRLEGDGTCSFELVSPSGQDLPGFRPGGHIDLHLPGSLVRSYSLLNGPGELGCYRFAVKREPASRGGSAWLHDVARVGMAIDVSPPSNDFDLIEDAPASCLIAGGIGITPILSMISHLNAQGKRWELHYCARSRACMAFLDELQALESHGNGTLHCYLDDEGGRLDLKKLVQSVAPDAHLYCCGPAGMIDGFIDATQPRNQETVHFERFASSLEAATDGGFDVHLARDGRTLAVAAGQSILDTLLDAGLDVPYACTQGICGSCMATVVDGIPDHRDECLTDEQREANDRIIICCSGSQSRTLTLDL